MVILMNKHFPELTECYGQSDSSKARDNWKLALFEIIVYLVLICGLSSMIKSLPIFSS